MSNFEKRERAEESKFASNEELEFKATARRNRALGLWAAGLLGLSDDSAQKYADTVVAADLHVKGDDDVYNKVAKDFADAKIEVSEHKIRREMAEMLNAEREKLGLK